MPLLCRLFAAALLATAGAAAMAQEKTGTPQVRIYDAAELTLDRYTVVKRIWAGTWRASFWVPSHAELADAIEALRERAVDAGADGVVNLHCLNDPGWGGGYFCYGLAIKLKQAPSFIDQPSPGSQPAAGG
ncbi:MAG: hypothetical protein ACRET6_14235 [Burkholderiales bacterium]